VLAAVNAFWSTGHAIQRPFLCLAQHMALNPDPVLGPYSISSDRARQLLRSHLGTNWRQAAGYDKQDPLYEILEGDGGFVVTQHNLGWCFRLDLEMLLGRSRAVAAAAATAAAAAASSNNGTSHSTEGLESEAWQQHRISSSSGDDSDDDLLMLLGVASSGWMPEQQQQQQQQAPQHGDQMPEQQHDWLQQYSSMQHQQQQPHPRQQVGQQQLLEPVMMPEPHVQQQQQGQVFQQAQGHQMQPEQQRQLLAAIKDRYAMQGGTDRVKAALAYHLVKATGDSQYGQPPHSVLFLEIDRVLRGALGPGWMQRWGVTESSLQQLLQQDPVFAGIKMPDGRWVVQLQVGELLHWQQHQLAASQLLQQL
jgi:hypothetical protein